MIQLNSLLLEKVVLVLNKSIFENKTMDNIKKIKNCFKKYFVFIVFIFTLFVSFYIFDFTGNENVAKAEECSNPLDVMMVIDISGSMSESISIDERRIDIAKNAALSFIDNVNLDEDRIGIETFSTNVILFEPGLDNNRDDIISKINSIDVESGGQTKTDAAISAARGELDIDFHGRSYASRVMIILSDGEPSTQINVDSDDTPIDAAIAMADMAKSDGIRIVTIGLAIGTDSPAEIFLKEIASAPGDYYSTNSLSECKDESGNDINYLFCVYRQISESICDGTPPEIRNISNNRTGTLYSGDDFEIRSEVEDDYGIKDHKVKWSSDGWSTTNIEQCTIYEELYQSCIVNIGKFSEGTTIVYKTFVVDTNENSTEGTQDGDTYKNIEVASTTMEINGEINGTLTRNDNNTIKININDDQGYAHMDDFYVSVIGGGMEFSKQAMAACSGDGYNRSCSNFTFSPNCSSDASVDVFVYPYSYDGTGYHNYVRTKSVNLVNPLEKLSEGNCSDGIDNDCDGLIDMESGFEESMCDNVAPVVSIERRVSGVEKTDIFASDSVTLSSTVFDLPLNLNGLSLHTIFWFVNGVEQTAQSCGSSSNCEKLIGAFPVGTEIAYYVKATDNSVNSNFICGPAGCSTYYSYIVQDVECAGKDDLTECSFGVGVCCNSVCDTSLEGNSLDDECSVIGCSGSNWGWVPANDTAECIAGVNADGCYDVGTGCEKRNYSCSAGSCVPVIYDQFDDVCNGLVLDNYGCNVLECEIISSGDDSSCDNELRDISVEAADSEGISIPSGGVVFDSKTSVITFISHANDDFGIDQHKIFWTMNNWITSNEIDCGGVDICSESISEPLSVGDTVQYYSWAVDGSGQSGETAYYSSFTVVDSTCYGADDMTSCNVSGRCCGGVCDTSFDSSTLYDIACATPGCNAESWEYLPVTGEEAGCSAFGDGCFSYFSGCEERNYSCMTGICSYTPVNPSTDVCTEDDVFKNFSCSASDCLFSEVDCSLACGCNCGSYGIDEKIYSSLEFDGINDYVRLRNPIFLADQTSFSAGAWIKTTSGSTNIMNIFGGQSDALYMTIYNNKVAWNTGGWKYSTTSVNDGQWHHIFYTLGSDYVSIYVDGNREYYGVSGYKKAKWIEYIGSYIDLAFHFNGQMDDVRIYNRTLSTDDIALLYQGIYDNESGLMGYWNFDNVVNGVVLDSSVYANNGTLGSATVADSSEPILAKSFDDPLNVPSYWRACTDLKDNDCDDDIDELDAGCDGEVDMLEVFAKYGVSGEFTIPDNGGIYQSDMGNLKLKSTTWDFFGINSHFINWEIEGSGLTLVDCPFSESCEVSVGVLSEGAVVKYQSFVSDINNNSICDPIDCESFYSFTVRDVDCFDIVTETNISGDCFEGVLEGFCCGGFCDTSFDDSNINSYETDCMIEGCAEESWEWIQKSNGSSCNSAETGLCSVFSGTGCEIGNYECSSGICESASTSQQTDFCIDDSFRDFGCDGACTSTDHDCSVAGTFDGDSIACNCNCGGYDLDEKIYSSLSFDGASDYVYVAQDLFNPNTGTIEVWVKSNGLLDRQGIIHSGNGGGWGPGPEITIVKDIDNTIMFTQTNGLQIKSPAITVGTWYHIIAVYDDTNASLYIDGDLVGTDTWGGVIDKTNWTSGRLLFIGAINTGMRWWNGLIDEVRIYNRAIPDSEALQHYQGVYQDESGIVGHWKFDDSVPADTAIDSSGAGNTGAVNGPIWAKSFKLANKNNVPQNWQVCTDEKDNDCYAGIDAGELACDGELDALIVKATLPLSVDDDYPELENLGQVKDIDTDKIRLVVDNYDSSGIKNVIIEWTVDGNSFNKKCGYDVGDEDFEDDLTCLVEIGPFGAGASVKYKAQGVDNVNNSKCSPEGCDAEYSFDVIASNISPVISNLIKRQDEGYCSGLNKVTFLWDYYDEDAEEDVNTQNYIEIQIKKGDITDNPDQDYFTVGIFLVNTGLAISSHFYTYNPENQVSGQTFEYNSTYFWRLRVKDVKGAFSDWVIYDDVADPDGDGNSKSFTTAVHQYPEADFEYSPIYPDFGEEIIITDISTVYDGYIKEWKWDFENNGIYDEVIQWIDVSTVGDVTHIYTNPTYNFSWIKLTTTDSSDFVCSIIKQIDFSVGREYPKWNEIAPYN